MVKKSWEWQFAMWVLILTLLLGGCSSVSNSQRIESKGDRSADALTHQESKDAAAVVEQPIKGGGGPQVKFQPERKLIYEAQLHMEVADYGAVKDKLSRFIKQSHGYVLQFSDQETDSMRGGNYVIKVPALGFQSFIDELGKWESIAYTRQYSANDVTEEYVDLQARLKARRTVEARLISFMEKATKSDDLLRFSTELGNVQSEIEQIVGKMRYYDNNVAMSTISLDMFQRLKAKPSHALEDAFGTQVVDTIVASWEALIKFTKYIVLILIALLPFACAFLIIGIPIWFIVKRKKGKRGISPVLTIVATRTLTEPADKDTEKH
ncbi:DUF4349 domain-containing protein [Paenibacillus alvei]|uniref:DUF4349 domain-containing protein n=1 Tax=Paenibacillus alvei TaxID=44250 RepID=A0AAP6ZVE2_PAEAL|nr:DUF4349 domain-containing protein [Paenibacillus alvei]NOJ69695.1 DUF4349 domain-containing protein [Paenibacillus alvei]